MPISIRVSSNVKSFQRYLTGVQRKQIPFATSQALNATAFDVRKQIVERTYPAAFDVKARAFARAAFRVDKASKGVLRAALFDRLGRANLALHAKGGTRRPRGGALAIPMTVKRTAGGRVPKGKTPSALRGKRTVFKAPVGTGNMGIWERTRSGTRLLYTLAPAAKIERRFNFYEDAARTVRQRFDGNFRRAMTRALATAR